MQTIRHRYQLYSMFQLEARFYGSWKSQASHVWNFFNWYLDAAEYLKARIIYRETILTQIVIERGKKYRKANAWIYELSFKLRLTVILALTQNRNSLHSFAKLLRGKNSYYCIGTEYHEYSEFAFGAIYPKTKTTIEIECYTEVLLKIASSRL